MPSRDEQIVLGDQDPQHHRAQTIRLGRGGRAPFYQTPCGWFKRPASAGGAGSSVGQRLERLGPVHLPRSVCAEQMLRQHQVHEDGEVDHHRPEPDERDALDELVDLQREESRGREHGEVLGPTPFAPQPDRFEAGDDRVDRGEEREHAERMRLHVTEAGQQRGDDAVRARAAVAVARLLWSASSMPLAQPCTASRFHRQREGRERDRAERDRVHGPVDGDDADQDRLPQRAPVPWSLDVFDVFDRRARPGCGWVGHDPVAAPEALHQPAAVDGLACEHVVAAVEGQHRRAGHDVAAPRAYQQLGPSERVFH